MRRTILSTLAILLLTLACTAHRQAGTGDVAFRLVWDGDTDLDLLVEDPGGACIFYGQRKSELGGLLDVDCNAGTERMCEHPIENVFWPVGTAPPGRYRFWVHTHALYPAEAPLPFEIQLLSGTSIAWRHAAETTEHEELFGPFLYDFPGGEVTLAPPSDAPPTGCAALAPATFAAVPADAPDQAADALEAIAETDLDTQPVVCEGDMPIEMAVMTGDPLTAVGRAPAAAHGDRRAPVRGISLAIPTQPATPFPPRSAQPARMSARRSTMAQPSIKQQILEDFDRLSPEMQRRAQELVHGLAVSTPRSEGTPGKDLLRFAGILDEDAAREMERMIEEGCERVDLDAW